MKVAMPQRYRRIRHDFGTPPRVWRGPVERREPRHYQRQGDVGIRRCTNRLGGCALWIPSDATRCPHCHERQG